MNKLGIWAIVVAFAFALGTVFSADIATAVKPVTDVLITNTEPIPVTGSISSKPVCQAENIHHWTLISFEISQTVDHDTLPDLEPLLDEQFPSRPNTFEVKILQDIDVDIFANQMVADRLTELGYFNGSTIGQPFDVSGFFNIDVEYSTICAEN